MKRKYRATVLDAAFIAAAVTLIVAAFPPFDVWPAAWVALVPWLIALHRGGTRRALILSAGLGLALNVILLSWLRFVTVAGWLALAVYLSAYVPAAGILARWIRRKCAVPLALLLPPIWVGLDYLRCVLFTGFPWFLLGHTQHVNLPFIQIADLTGVHGVTFALVMVNGLLADLLLLRTSKPALSRRTLLSAAAAAAAVVVCLFAYGLTRLGMCETTPGPALCLVQGNIPMSLKHSPDPGENFRLLKRHEALSLREKDRPVDLLVWPETMMPGTLQPEFRYLSGEFRQAANEAITRMTRETGSHLLIGATAYDPAKKGFYNSAYFISPKGKHLGRYDKIHRVVFGEYTPLAGIFPFLRKLRPAVMGPDMEAGTYRPPFKLKSRGQPLRRFVVTICYEDTEARVTRKLVGMGADFMVNITNDGWFPSDGELAQHNAIAVFRAIENRVPVARCANTGMSSFIAPTGRVQSRLEKGGRYREVEGILVNRLVFCNLTGFYTRCGDAFAWVCILAALALATAAYLRKP